jgi:hypothetical protein
MVAAIAVVGCTLDEATLPPRPSEVVVHGVLTTATQTQTILVERTLTGEATLMPFVPRQGAVGAFYPGEQIESDGGIAERGAVVEIVTPGGQAVPAPEVSSFSPVGEGAGMYRAAITGASLVAGGRYQLRVRTTRGELITAETVIPAIGAPVIVPASEFNRGTGSLALSWSPAGTARAYEIRVDNPYLAWISLTHGTAVTLAGSLRNVDTDNLAAVFVPGFRQVVTVSAVDSNLYDYYRTVNTGFTGSGIVNRVKGGIGVFGSYSTILRRSIDVSAPVSRPIEGIFDLIARPDGEKYGGVTDAASMTLYVESPSAKAGQPDAITGQVRHTTGTAVGAVVGTWDASELKLRFLQAQALSDTADSFTGSLRGDTLDGKFSKGAAARYLKRRP